MAPVGDDDTLVGTPHTAETAAAIPALVGGRYQIVRWLGGGGMGRVYEVRDVELGERVALKMLRGDLSSEALERFRREVRLTRKIQHPNVARMFDIGETGDGERFLTMELIDGEALSASLGAPMPWATLKPIAVQICAGLAAAHDKGVTHRDLKPDNVLIERATGRAVLTDFGIARSADDAMGNVTQTGMIVGTPRYMAPEQLAGTAIDGRADVFSLGVMLYELATGTRPWAGDNAISIAVAQATQPMRPFAARGVPGAFGALVEELLAVDREQRPASASEIGARIEALGQSAADPGPSLSTAELPRPSTATHLAAPPVAEQSAIAVLPFTCSAGDEHLVDGLREDLIDMLSTTPGLRVRPAGADARDVDPRVRGRELGVDHVVVGSLRRTPSGGGLRIAARLVGVADGFQIWAHRIDCAETDLLAIGDQLGQAIAGALSTRAASRELPTDPRAIELFLRARAELRRFWGEHALAASQLLEEAAALAPASGPIAGLLACSTAVAWGKLNRADLRDKARLYADRAIALDHYEGYLAKSIVHWNEGDIELAARDVRFALDRSPMSPAAHEHAGRLLAEIDPGPAGYKHLQTVAELDPLRLTVVSSDLARAEALAGNWDSAWARTRFLLENPDPAVQQYGAIVNLRLSVWRGDLAGIHDALERAAQQRLTAGGGGLAELARMAIAGRPFDRALWSRTLAEIAAPDRPRRLQLSVLQRSIEIVWLLGRRDEMIEAMRFAVQYGLADVVWADRCPLFANVDDVRWRALRDEVAARAARALAVFRPQSTNVTVLGVGDAGRR